MSLTCVDISESYSKMSVCTVADQSVTYKLCAFVTFPMFM